MKSETVSTRGELVWCPQWNLVGEGPYTIVAKLLNANNLKTRYLKDTIRWRNGTGASLLDLRLNGSETNPATQYGKILHQASLAARIPRLYKELANDRELRYCATCMSTGFQAAIAQIPGVVCCPIHGEIHRNTCIRCGHKTPPYFLEESTWIPGFSCRACGAPFGGKVLIDRQLDAWKSPGDLNRLDSIHRLLKRIDDSTEFHWINVSEWSLARISSGDADNHKRRIVFDVLRSQLPDESIPESSLEEKPRIFGPYRVDPDMAFQQLTQAEYEDVLGRLLTPPELKKHRNYFLTPSFGVAVPTDPIVPPELHAHLIWRAQFERVSSTYSQFYSRWEFCRNAIPGLFTGVSPPVELSLSSIAIMEGVLGASWLAALEIAKEWNQTLVGFCKQNSIQPNLQWLTAVDQWANRLGCWRNRSYFPVGVIRVADTATGEHQLYFVVV